MEIQKDRPPYVTFEVRQEEDRMKSFEQGVYVAKDVNYALITPAGSKDRIERVADEWLKTLEQQVREERFPAAWLSAYKETYKAWKEDRVIPDNGHPIVNWPVVSPAQVKTLLDLHVRTIEDLAAANEETISRLGMGGRALKQRAVEWLNSADHGRNSADIEKLAAEVEALKIRNESLAAANLALTAQVSALTGEPQKL